MLLFARQARDDVSRKHDHRGAIEPLHRSESLFELGEEGIARGRVSNSIMQPGGCIKVDAEALAQEAGEDSEQRRREQADHDGRHPAE